MAKFHFKKTKNIVKKLTKRISEKRFLIPLALLAIFLLLAAIGLSPGPRQKISPEDKIIQRVVKFDEVSQYKDFPAQTKLLSRQEIEERKTKFPLIYKDLSGEIYEIRFSSGEGGILLLYDAASDKILRTFNLLQWDQ